MISWIQSQITREPNKLIICEICHHKVYYEADTERIWDTSNCQRRLDRLNSCYIAILFSCILCLIILSVLLRFGNEMALTTGGKVVLILGLILMIISTGLILAAIGRIIMTKRVKNIVKVYSREQAIVFGEDFSIRSRSRSRSRRTIGSRSASRATSTRNMDRESNPD